MSIEATLGALLIGSLACIYLSGTVALQVAVYFQIYPKDRVRTKLIVVGIWILDLVHTGMVSASNWSYLIENFGVPGISDRIPWTVAATIAFTALLTFVVHCFFAQRVFTLSNRNWYITLPILILALTRLGFALTTTSKMIKLKSFVSFIHTVSWIFTMGLSLAVAVDILIAASCCWFLNRNRSDFSSMNSIINSITLYTIETGLLTCIVTIISLICWIAMPGNLVFLGMHFVISKMYANALLATLNARKRLRGRSQSSSEREMPIMFPDRFSNRGIRFSGTNGNGPMSPKQISQLQISVEKTIDVDGEEIDLPSISSEGGSRDPPSPTQATSKHSATQLTFA